MAPNAFARLVLVICLAIWSAQTHAMTEGRATLPVLIDRAHVIALGTVVDTQSLERFFGDYVRIVTEATIDELEIVKGDDSDTSIVVTQFGGQVGDVMEWYPGLPRLDVGQRYLMFLTRADSDLLIPLGLQGLFVVTTDPERAVDVVLSTSGQLVVDVRDDEVVYGDISEESGDSRDRLGEAMSLELFLDQIRSRMN